ncbi:MAG: methionyl-tRNA formyltransferase [Alphaproteobacteria bacterium]
MTKRKIVFMGTPDFAVPALQGLIDAGHDIIAVYSQPPRPAGRGHKLTKSPVHRLAESHNIPVFTPKNFKNADDVQAFCNHKADIAVVAAYGLILPKSILEAPAQGCLNIHGSLLPRWRGAAPIHRAIEAGDSSTGITIMQMDEGLDTGDMIIWDQVDITRDMTTGILHDILAEMGAVQIVKAIEQGWPRIPQPADGVAYAHKITRDEEVLDWTQPAEVLERKIRAFSPWPATYFLHDGLRYKVLSAEITTDAGAPGEILDDMMTIACAKGAIRPTRLQRQGGKPMDLKDFLNGHAIAKGTRLCSATS